jgi:class 3 adenylate cyclase
MERPETRYVVVRDAAVAYQVFGEGPIDLLYAYGLGSHLDLMWEVPRTREVLVRLASFSRVIAFDRRGMGASDPVSLGAMPTWEEWAEDMLAVLDAAGSTRTAILASADAGPIAIMFAAMHPELVSALVLHNTSARYLAAEDVPFGVPEAGLDFLVGAIAEAWGTVDFMRVADPNVGDEEHYRLAAQEMRASATPRTAAAMFDYLLRNGDVRPALPLIHAPTLVLHATDWPFFSIEHGRYLTANIDGAKFVELSGVGGALDPTIADEVAEFLTGERPAVEIERILTTVLFTDIIGSTAKAASLGDHRWRALLDSHDKAVRAQLHRFRGREINTTGDGFVASFDGPARAIRCAQAIKEATASLGIELRIGLHTGECEVRGDDLGGLAVHVAARIGALATGEILVSGIVKDLVAGSGIEFTERGEHELKGVPGSWKLFAVAA